MVAVARRRREEKERQPEAQQQREDSPPTANQIISNATGHTSDSREHEDLQERDTPARETPSRRRRRSLSLDLSTSKEHERKYTHFTEAQCDRFALRGSRRSLVQEFAKVDYLEKIITPMAFLQRSESEQAGSDIQAYLVSGAFKAHATALLYTAIVAPHSKGYVTAFGSFIANDMACNFPLYKIDKSIIEDEEARSTLNTHMGNKLTALRNAIKENLEAAADKGYCMNQLMIFKEALENHEKEYPTVLPPPEEVDPSSWQIMLERTMYELHHF